MQLLLVLFVGTEEAEDDDDDIRGRPKLEDADEEKTAGVAEG